FGGTAGIVTLDGIIAQLVGEIRDEFDTAQEIFITPLPDGKKPCCRVVKAVLYCGQRNFSTPSAWLRPQ
ncbi:MAG TPA: hypothetical protein PLR69_09390, partial [Candidatus Limiplasma sp.]|nr:hypothetical protein [Candidatus Limiplasma sp.]